MKYILFILHPKGYNCIRRLKVYVVSRLNSVRLNWGIYLSQLQHFFQDESFVLSFEIVWEEGVIDEVEPFDECFAEFLGDVFKNLFADARGHDALFEIFTAQFCFFAVESQGQFLFVLGHDDGR